MIETLTFEVTCDTQKIMSAADDDEAVIITLQTEDVWTIGYGHTGAAGAPEVRDACASRHQRLF